MGDGLKGIDQELSDIRERLNVSIPKSSYEKDVLTEGMKYDGDKLRFDLIPPEPLERLAEVYTMGAAKYEDRNWEKGIKWGRVFGAIMRHMWAWWKGEDVDPESGLPHLAHAAWGCFALLEYRNTRRDFDDRVKGTSTDNNEAGVEEGTIQECCGNCGGTLIQLYDKDPTWRYCGLCGSHWGQLSTVQTVTVEGDSDRKTEGTLPRQDSASTSHTPRT